MLFRSINDEQYNRLNQKINDIEKLITYLKETRITPTTIPTTLKEIINLNSGISLYELLKRPEITLDLLINNNLVPNDYSDEVKEQVTFKIKYEGYIAKEEQEAEKLLKLEKKEIPDDIDYDKVKNLASEAKSKLKQVRPRTIAQASRISGVNPVDISVLSIYLKKEYPHE